MIEGKQKALAIAAHIGYLFFGIGFVLLPLLLFLFYDGKDNFVATHAKQALIVQAVFGVISAIVSALTALLIGFLFWPVIAVMAVVWVFCSLKACLCVLNGEDYHYPFL